MASAEIEQMKEQLTNNDGCTVAKALQEMPLKERLQVFREMQEATRKSSLSIEQTSPDGQTLSTEIKRETLPLVKMNSRQDGTSDVWCDSTQAKGK